MHEGYVRSQHKNDKPPLKQCVQSTWLL